MSLVGMKVSYTSSTRPRTLTTVYGVVISHDPDDEYLMLKTEAGPEIWVQLRDVQLYSPEYEALSWCPECETRNIVPEMIPPNSPPVTMSYDCEHCGHSFTWEDMKQRDAWMDFNESMGIRLRKKLKR